MVDTVVQRRLESAAYRFTREGVGLTPLLGARVGTAGQDQASGPCFPLATRGFLAYP